MLQANRAVIAFAIALAGTLPASATWTTDAYAQPPDPKSRADAAYKEGVELSKAGKTEAALTKFEAAYSLAPTALAVYQIARMEQSLGRYALALSHFRDALKESNLSTDARREGEKAVLELKTKIGVITLDVPAGSSTTVDGNEVDAAAPIEVVPGLHIVKVRLGGETKSADVTSPAGVVTPVKIRFTEEPKPVDAPKAAVAPPATEHEKWPSAKQISVGGGAVASAGLLIATGIVFLGSNGYDKPANASSCIDPSAPGCADLAKERESYDSSRTTATVLFYSGLVAGVLTVAAVFLWPNEHAASTALSKTRFTAGRRKGVTGLSFQF